MAEVHNQLWTKWPTCPTNLGGLIFYAYALIFGMTILVFTFLSKFCWASSYKSQLNILLTASLTHHRLTSCCQVQALLPPKISEFFAEFTFSFMHAGTKEKIMKKKHGAAVIVSSLSQSHSFIRPWLTITQDMKDSIVCITYKYKLWSGCFAA